MNCAKVVQVINFSGTIPSFGQLVAWSENNDLAFCTLECINIVEPLLYSFNVEGSSPISIQRDVIDAPSQVNQFDFGINRNELHLTLPRDEMYRFMLDRTLSPAVPCMPPYKGYVEAAWSPAGIGTLGTCALAALTKDHRLTIFIKKDRKWVTVAELSQSFYEYLQSRNYDMPWIVSTHPPVFQTQALQDLHMKSYATAALKIVWSHVMNCNVDDDDDSSGKISNENLSGCFALLAVGMRNGCVVLWKVETSMNSSEDMMLEKIFDTCLGAISALCWLELMANSGILTVGDSNGRISMYTVIAEPEEGISIEHINTLWNEGDGLKVSHISCFKESNQLFYVVAAKGNYIFAWELHGNKVTNKAHQMGCFLQAVTGIFADSGAFYASTADGMLCQITLTKDDNGFGIACREVLADIRDGHMTYAGLCCSPNKLLFCVVQNIGTFYDHLAVREPLELLIVKHKSVEESISLIWSLCETRSPFSYFMDVLQYLYYCWLDNRQLPEELLRETDLNVKELRMQTVPKLQLLRWLHQLTLFSEPNESRQSVWRTQMEIINGLLIEHQLLTLIRKSSSDQSLFMEDKNWMHALMIICQWFGKCLNELQPSDQKLVVQLLTKIQSMPESKKENGCEESCKLCSTSIPLDTIHYGKCPRGHTFGRCSLSLQLCDKSTFKKCVNCSVLADENICSLVQNARCPFCSRIFE